jgi:hypothetical protein
VSLHVVEAMYLHGHTLRLKFVDRAEGEIDVENALEGDVFGPLRDEEAFRCVTADPELFAVVWKYGADFSPELRYGKVRVLTWASCAAVS